MNRTGTTSRLHYAACYGVAATAIAGVCVGFALSATGPVAGVEGASEVVSVGIPLVRALFDVAAVSTVGLALLPLLLGAGPPRPAEQVLARARSAAVVTALVWATTALVLLVLETAEFSPAIGFGDVRAHVAELGSGKALLIVAGLALALAVLGVLAVRSGGRVPAEVLLGVGLFALMPLPVTGHASSGELGELMMVSLELHVLSAAVWVGGLGALTVLLAGSRTLLAAALPRFSRLATVCVLVTAVTGLFNGVAELARTPTVDLWPALFTTAYGRLALLKVACLGGIAALGAHARWRLLPRIVRHERTALAGWAALELALMGLALGFAAVLVRAPVS